MADGVLIGKIKNDAAQTVQGGKVKQGSQKGGVVKTGGDLRAK